MNSIISFNDVSYAYTSHISEQKTWALQHINLEIEKGSFVAIVGRNGSGKSTLSKHINALLLPESGTVTVKGMETTDEEHLWEIRRSAGMVFQNPDNQLVATIVEEDVALGPENLGVPREEIVHRVETSLDHVEMLRYRHKAPHMLSGGQKQRIAIAGVIALHPDIVIMDEPTAMLDPIGRSEVMKVAVQLHKEGITVVLITHFMDEAALSDRIVVMDSGSIVMDDVPSEIFKRVDELEALDLAAPPMVKLGDMLQRKGVELPQAFDVDEMAEVLCPNKKKK